MLRREGPRRQAPVRALDDTLLPLLRNPRVRGPIVHDARVAALCIAHGVDELLTKDRDFQLFPQLRVRDPLTE
ncbi:MAG TPA: hypothetical protein VFG38_15530 [Pseudomonadales bacterium]|nr:hypothetical protein [Pseudomonadales bacterium]